MTRHGLSFAVAMGIASWTAVHALAACGEEVPVDPGVADARIVYEASHPALDALVAAPLLADAEQAAYLLEPADGATVDATAPFTFRWRVGPHETSHNTPRTPRSELRLGLLPPDTPTADLWSWVAPVRVAHAHGPPISGRGYYLVAEDEDGVIRYRVWTTALEHTPNGSDWDFLVDATGSLRVTVVNAIFDNDVIVEGGGPWQGPSSTFSF